MKLIGTKAIRLDVTERRKRSQALEVVQMVKSVLPNLSTVEAVAAACDAN